MPDDQPLGSPTDREINFLKLKYALENSHIGVWEWDINANKVYHSNESRIIFGFKDSEMDLSETDWTEQIHPDDLDNLMKVVNDHVQSVTKEYRSEHRILCGDGSYKWVLDRGKIVSYDSDNQPTRFIGTTIDITQQKLDEERKNQSLSIITNQNKKLKNFAHIVTHNLKEHAGNFESLLKFYTDAESAEEKNEIVDHLKTVSDSLSNTIDSLREIVTRQLTLKIELKPLNFNQYVNKVLKLLELEINDKKAMIVNNVSNDLILHSNEAYLESIILNLASNAIKYSHPERTPLLQVDSIVSTDQITLSLTDNGIGIDLEKFGKEIFGLYNTFHGNDNAEGIGLYITKNQIESLGGTIAVESVVGEGTTFKVNIKHKKASH